MSENGAVRTAEYPYPNLEDGKTYLKYRIDPPGDEKKVWTDPGFSPEQLDLFNGDLLDDPRFEGKEVFITEGEEKAKRLASFNLLGVSFAGGSSQRRFHPKALARLKGRVVNLWPDNDEPGLKYDAALIEAVRSVGPKGLRLLEPVSSVLTADVVDLLEGIGQEDWQMAHALVQEYIDHAEDVLPKPPQTSRIRLYAAADLVAMELAPIPEPVPGLFLAGHTMLSGAPKMGKSFVILSVAVGKSGGRPILGKIFPEAGPVLWMPLEDGLRRTVTRLKQYLGDFPAPDNLTLAFDWPGLSDGGLQYIEVWLKDHPHGTVLIDTGKRLWNADDEQRGNGSMADYNFIGPLTDLYRDHDAFGLTVWHDRKMLAADFFDQISATRGMTANVDGVANLSRDRGSKEAKLSIGHRDGEDKAFSLHWDDMLTNWLLVEQVDVAVAKNDPKVRVLIALRTLDCDLGVEAIQITEHIGDMALATVRNKLTELKKDRVVMNVNKGRWKIAPQEDDDDE